MRWNTRFAVAAFLLEFPVSFAIAQDSGRLAASNCFQCHGTDGTSSGFERLAGESAAEIIEEMWELRVPQNRADPEKEIMTVHANGYTSEQIIMIADYLSKASRARPAAIEKPGN